MSKNPSKAANHPYRETTLKLSPSIKPRHKRRSLNLSRLRQQRPNGLEERLELRRRGVGLQVVDVCVSVRHDGMELAGGNSIIASLAVIIDIYEERKMERKTEGSILLHNDQLLALGRLQGKVDLGLGLLFLDVLGKRLEGFHEL